MAAVDRTQQIGPLAGGAAPFSYVVPPSYTFGLIAVRAVFDGAAAASDFVPVLQLVSDSGEVMAQAKGESVLAGGSADATFAPFLGDAGGGGYSLIQDEGVNITKRHTLDFIGSAVTVADNPATGVTEVTVGPSATGDVGCRVFNSANITTVTTVRQAFTFDTEVYDTDGMHSTTVNPERITCQTAGKYLVGGAVTWDANAAGLRDLGVYQNSLGGFCCEDVVPVTGAARVCGMSVNTVVQMAVGDYIELRGRQDSGGNLDVLAINYYSPYFWAQRFSS